MVTEDILSCLKKLRLNRSIAKMSEEIEAESNQEYLLKLLSCEIKRREETKKASLEKAQGFIL